MADRWRTQVFETEAANASYVVGVDVARFGPDKTMLAFRQGPILRKFTSWHQADTMTTRNRVKQACTANNVGRFDPAVYGPGLMGKSVELVVDVVGVGAGVFRTGP